MELLGRGVSEDVLRRKGVRNPGCWRPGRRRPQRWSAERTAATRDVPTATSGLVGTLPGLRHEMIGHGYTDGPTCSTTSRLHHPRVRSFLDVIGARRPTCRASRSAAASPPGRPSPGRRGSAAGAQHRDTARPTRPASGAGRTQQRTHLLATIRSVAAIRRRLEWLWSTRDHDRRDRPHPARSLQPSPAWSTRS